MPGIPFTRIADGKALEAQIRRARRLLAAADEEIAALGRQRAVFADDVQRLIFRHYLWQMERRDDIDARWRAKKEQHARHLTPQETDKLIDELKQRGYRSWEGMRVMKAVLALVIWLWAAPVLAQESYRVNETRSLAWDYDGPAITRFEVNFMGVWIDVAMAQIWSIPVLSAGSYVAEVRACADTLCGPTAGIGWTVLALTDPTPAPTPQPPPPPNRPGNLRFVVPPPTTVVTMDQAAQLAQSYSFIWTLTALTQGQLNQLQSLYTGVVPPTYQSVTEFLAYFFTHPR